MRILISSIFFVVIILSISCGKIEPAEMQLQPTSLSFGETETEKKISIVNIGDERLDWYIDTAFYIESWISVSPISGINDGTVTVNVDRTGLTHGSYKGELVFKSNGGDKNVEVIMVVF